MSRDGEPLYLVHAFYAIPAGSACQGFGIVAFVGSENISAESLDQNRELGIIVSDAAVLSKLQATFQKDWAVSQGV
jgi:cardiolipin synthase